MAAKQRMRLANEKASKNVTLRGNVPKSTVSSTLTILLSFFLKNSSFPVLFIRFFFFSETREGVVTRWAMVISFIHICSVWIRCFPNNPIHPYGINERNRNIYHLFAHTSFSVQCFFSILSLFCKFSIYLFLEEKICIKCTFST